MPHSDDHRPDFMVTLGLAPPYAIEDVKQAYREKARATHPDRGGSAAAFAAVHEAFERAQAYLEFRQDRRGWIAGKMARYAALQEAVTQLEQLGAEVTAYAPEWLEQSYGDFAQLTEHVTKIRLADSPAPTPLINAMVENYASLRELTTLELPGCRLTDDDVISLSIFQQLRRLDISRTPVTKRALSVVDTIESLCELGLEGTNIGWWAKRSVASQLARRGGDGSIISLWKDS
jgi:hypothetical protein